MYKVVSMTDLLRMWKKIGENSCIGDEININCGNSGCDDRSKEAIETSAKSSICKIILIYFEKIEKSYANFKLKE